MIDVRLVSLNEITEADNFRELLAEYAAASAIKGLPYPSPRIDIYQTLEKSGVYKGFAAFRDGGLIGFFMALWTINPHYGVAIAFMESFFVTKRYRRTGAAIKLLRFTEKYFRDLKAPGLFITAPKGSDLEKILPRLGYDETNTVFLKRFA
ncbi:MAG: GNAT family N-acetyltransferase [Patescibacteria group bacterium]|nr:GNAT family N-acetyltransferase [Patescibacteria group bacterium]